MSIDVELPDGRVVTIETDDPAVAASAAKKFLGNVETNSAPKEYTGALLPFKTTTYADGTKTRELAVPRVLQDVAKVVMEGGEAARGLRDPEEPARNAAGLLIGTGFAPQMVRAAPAAMKVAAKDASNAALSVKAIATMPKAAMDLGELHAAKRAAYDAAQQSGVIVDPNSFANFVANLPRKLEAFHEDVSPGVAEKTAAAIGGLRKTAAKGNPLSLEEIDTMRKAIGQAAQTQDKTEAALLSRVRDEFDNYLDGLDRRDLMPFMDEDAAREGVKQLKYARDLAHRAFKIEDIQFIRDAALNTNDPRYVQNQFRAIVRNKNKYNRYTPQEKIIINKIARTGTLEGVSRILSPSGSMDITGGARLMTGIGAGYLFGGPTGAAVVPGAAYLGRRAFDLLREKRVGTLIDTMSHGDAAPSFMTRLAAERARLRAMNTPPNPPP